MIDTNSRYAIEDFESAKQKIERDIKIMSNKSKEDIIGEYVKKSIEDVEFRVKEGFLKPIQVPEIYKELKKTYIDNYPSAKDIINALFEEEKEEEEEKEKEKNKDER